MKGIGEFLKYIRKQRELTQEQVAERLNVATPVLSKWENGKAVPPLDMLCGLCNVLNVSVEECIAAEVFDGERVLPPENYDAVKLGCTLKELRIKNGLSQAEVGKKIFVTSQTVSKWEGGGVSSLEILCKLAELFGVTPTQLLTGLGRVPAVTENNIAANRTGKTKRFTATVIAVIFAAIVFLGAVAGLIAWLVIKNKNDVTPPAHVHTWSGWEHDTTYHWQKCECGEITDSVEHTYVNDKCSECGYEKPTDPPRSNPKYN